MYIVVYIYCNIHIRYTCNYIYIYTYHKLYIIESHIIYIMYTHSPVSSDLRSDYGWIQPWVQRKESLRGCSWGSLTFLTNRGVKTNLLGYNHVTTPMVIIYPLITRIAPKYQLWIDFSFHSPWHGSTARERARAARAAKENPRASHGRPIVPGCLRPDVHPRNRYSSFCFWPGPIAAIAL